MRIKPYWKRLGLVVRRLRRLHCRAYLPDIIGRAFDTREVNMRNHLVVRAIAIVIAVSLVGCVSTGGEAETERRSVSKKKVAGVVWDYLIVPGKRIGPMSVGMPVSQIYDVMGEPFESLKETATTRYVFEEMEVIVDEADGAVSTVLTRFAEFATKEGLSVGLTDLAVRAKLSKLPGQLLIKEEGEKTNYFTPGMIVIVSGGQVTSISIRPVSGVPGG
jgi:hypothetical protein